MSTTIGARIRQARLNAQPEMTQRQLALLLGKTNSTVSYWESGKNTPKLEEIKSIAVALKVSVMDLLGEEQEQRPPLPEPQLPQQEPPWPMLDLGAVRYEVSCKLQVAQWGGVDEQRLVRMLNKAKAQIVETATGLSGPEYPELNCLSHIFNVPPHVFLDPNFDPAAEVEQLHFDPSTGDKQLHAQVIAKALGRLDTPEAQDKAMAVCLQVIELAGADKNARLRKTQQ